MVATLRGGGCRRSWDIAVGAARQSASAALCGTGRISAHQGRISYTVPYRSGSSRTSYTAIPFRQSRKSYTVPIPFRRKPKSYTVKPITFISPTLARVLFCEDRRFAVRTSAGAGLSVAEADFDDLLQARVKPHKAAAVCTHVAVPLGVGRGPHRSDPEAKSG